MNHTRQVLFLLLPRLPCFSPPSTSFCPQPQFSTGFILQPTLFLYLSLHFYPSVSPVLLICMSCPDAPQGLLGTPTSTSQEFYLIFDDSFCKPVPFTVHVLFYSFFLILFCFTLLYHLLPSTLACISNTHMQKFI